MEGGQETRPAYRELSTYIRLGLQKERGSLVIPKPGLVKETIKLGLDQKDVVIVSYFYIRRKFITPC